MLLPPTQTPRHPGFLWVQMMKVLMINSALMTCQLTTEREIVEISNEIRSIIILEQFQENAKWLFL